MVYTQAEKEKIYDNLDKIKAYLETLQPQIRDRITIDFGPIKTYANWSREQEYHLSIDDRDISGRTGGLYLYYEKETASSSTSTTVYEWLDYAVALIKYWTEIKYQLLEKIKSQNRTISAINDFKV